VALLPGISERVTWSGDISNDRKTRGLLYLSLFYGFQGDHEPGKEPGDIVIQLEEREHPTFQRHGKDLTMRMDIDVSEALCGMRRPITTLDNR
jgi:hypothetical protein